MELAPPSASLADYDQTFARRRQQVVIMHIPIVVTVGMVVWIRSGFVNSVVALAAVLLLEASAVAAVVIIGRAGDARRRRAGLAPSWAAMASRSAIRGAREHVGGDARVIGDVCGRLRHTAAGFEWSDDSRLICWPAGATVSVYRTWGIKQPGLVRFTTADGRDDILVVTRAADLVRHLQTLHTLRIARTPALQPGERLAA